MIVRSVSVLTLTNADALSLRDFFIVPDRPKFSEPPLPAYAPISDRDCIAPESSRLGSSSSEPSSSSQPSSSSPYIPPHPQPVTTSALLVYPIHSKVGPCTSEKSPSSSASAGTFCCGIAAAGCAQLDASTGAGAGAAAAATPTRESS